MQIKLITRDFYGKVLEEQIIQRYTYPSEAEYAVAYLNSQVQSLIGKNRSYEVAEDVNHNAGALSSWRPLEKGQRWVNPTTGLGATIEAADNSDPNGRVLFEVDGGICQDNYTNAGFRVHYPHLAQQRKPYINEYWVKRSDRSQKVVVTKVHPSGHVELADLHPLGMGPRYVMQLRDFHADHDQITLKWDPPFAPIDLLARDQEPHGSVAGTAVVTAPETKPEQKYRVEVLICRPGQRNDSLALRRDLSLEAARIVLNEVCNDYVQMGWNLQNAVCLLESSTTIDGNTWQGFRYQRRSTICSMQCCANLYDTAEVTIEIEEGE